MSIRNVMFFVRMDYAMNVPELAHRLKEAREKAGFKTAADAARSIGANPVTYTAHESGGREYDRHTALLYAKNFGVHPAWLYFGTVQNAPQISNSADLMASQHHSRHNEIRPQEYEEFFEVPEQFLMNRLKIPQDRARILEIQGDSMYDPANPSAPGSFYPGERVIVDTDDVRPTPPGAFALHDGAGVIVKMVEVIPGSEPIRIRLTGRNPRYETYEVDADHVPIVGRVKAKISMV